MKDGTNLYTTKGIPNISVHVQVMASKQASKKPCSREEITNLSLNVNKTVIIIILFVITIN